MCVYIEVERNKARRGITFCTGLATGAPEEKNGIRGKGGGIPQGNRDEYSHNRLHICMKPPHKGRGTGYFFLNKCILSSSLFLLREQLIKQYGHIQCELGFHDVWFCNVLGAESEEHCVQGYAKNEPVSFFVVPLV